MGKYAYMTQLSLSDQLLREYEEEEEEEKEEEEEEDIQVRHTVGEAVHLSAPSPPPCQCIQSAGF